MTGLLHWSLGFAFLLPLLTSISLFFIPKQKEETISKTVYCSSLLYFFSFVTVFFSWSSLNFPVIEIRLGTLYQAENYKFPLVLLLDKIAMLFFFLTATLTLIITKYCRYYLHREEGFSRFFRVLFAFVFGMTFVSFAGSLDLFFAGWEVLGTASFLLIAFYHGRELPVRNAFQAYCVYRVCDVGLLLGTYLSQFIPAAEHTFYTLELANHSLAAHKPVAFALSCLILLTAFGKSAQIPFSFWLPRAMEGPTPSSAIFYGSLSTHAAILLMLRTTPIWFQVNEIRILLILTGTITAISATLSGRVQSNIKAQIAYASISQMALLYIELALGFFNLALFHLCAHAFLRCYQLLISPSVVAHVLRLQRDPSQDVDVSGWSLERRLPPTIRSTLYALSLNEGYWQILIGRFIVKPLRRSSFFFSAFLPEKRPARTAALLVLCALPASTVHLVPSLFLVLTLTAMLVFSLLSLSSRFKAEDIFLFCVLNPLLSAALVFGSGLEHWKSYAIYCSGILPAALVGYCLLQHFNLGKLSIASGIYEGKYRVSPRASGFFFLCCLCITGFPITPAFLGEDLILHHTVNHISWLAIPMSLSFIINGIALMRLYVHLFWGNNRQALTPVLT